MPKQFKSSLWPEEQTAMVIYNPVANTEYQMFHREMSSLTQRLCQQPDNVFHSIRSQDRRCEICQRPDMLTERSSYYLDITESWLINK